MQETVSDGYANSYRLKRSPLPPNKVGRFEQAQGEGNDVYIYRELQETQNKKKYAYNQSYARTSACCQMWGRRRKTEENHMTGP